MNALTLTQSEHMANFYYHSTLFLFSAGQHCHHAAHCHAVLLRLPLHRAPRNGGCLHVRVVLLILLLLVAMPVEHLPR